MIAAPGCLRIVHSWSDPNGPTGEGGRYETEDGRVWKDHYGPETTITGVEYRDVHGGEMCPRSVGHAASPDALQAREPNRKERRAARSRRR